MLLVTALMATTALGIDLMLPAFPDIRAEFGMAADATAVGTLVTVNAKPMPQTMTFAPRARVRLHAKGSTPLRTRVQRDRAEPPLPEALQEIVALGGNTGWLKRWWQEKQATKV